MTEMHGKSYFQSELTRQLFHPLIILAFSLLIFNCPMPLRYRNQNCVEYLKCWQNKVFYRAKSDLCLVFITSPSNAQYFLGVFLGGREVQCWFGFFF